MRTRLTAGLVLALLATAPILGVLDGGSAGDDTPRELRASGVRLEGDPVADDRWQARAQVADEAVSVELKQTPAPWLERAPHGERVQNASPLAPAEADLRLEAGPIVLEGPGELSPRFPLRARASVAADDVDRAWLRLDGERWALLEPAGTAGEREVFLGHLDPGVLPAQQTTHVDLVLERRVAPEVEHWSQGPGWDVYAEARGPPAPNVTASDGTIRLAGSADRYEAQARPAEGPWRPVPVHGATASDLEPDDEQVRARGVDRLGNAGTWSPPVDVVNASEDPSAVAAWQLVAPQDGDRVEGVVEIDWRPADASIPVQVRARSDPDSPWQDVARAQEPPVAWRTGFVPDGDWELHVRAYTDAGWTSRLLTVTVDNLEEAPVADEAPDESTASTPGGLPPRTTTPVSAALASGAGLLVVTGLAGRIWIRRAK